MDLREQLNELGSYRDPNIGWRLDIAFPETFMALHAVLDYADELEISGSYHAAHNLRQRIHEALIGC